MWFRGPFVLSLMSTLHTTNTTGGVPEECHSKTDIVALLDGSGSVVSADFQKEKDAVKTLANYLTLSPDRERLAVITYGGQVSDVITFRTDVHGLVKAISSVRKPRPGTKTHLAIDEMKLVFDGNGRRQAQKIGIVITDGKSNNPHETIKAALKSKDSGIMIFAVGVGRNVDMGELTAIASSESYVLTAASFDTLESQLLSILKADCKVDGGWSDWETIEIETCSATCGGGSKSLNQTRTCTNPMSEYGGKECDGPTNRTLVETCGSHMCPVDGGWSDWETVTGPCSETCGGGFRSVNETRICNNPEPEYRGKECKGQGTRQSREACGIQNCPVDGGWSDWETIEIETCSATCGGGSKSLNQTRTCTNPMSEYGGKECDGPTNRTLVETCGSHMCPETQACFEGCKSLPQRRPSAQLLVLKKNLRLKKKSLSAYRRKKMCVIGDHRYHEVFIAVFIVFWFPILALVIWDLMDLMRCVLSPQRRRRCPYVVY